MLFSFAVALTSAEHGRALLGESRTPFRAILGVADEVEEGPLETQRLGERKMSSAPRGLLDRLEGQGGITCDPVRDVHRRRDQFRRRHNTVEESGAFDAMGRTPR